MGERTVLVTVPLGNVAVTPTTPLHDRWGVICGAEKTRGRNRCGKEGKREVLVWVCETEDVTRHLREDAKDAVGLNLRGAEER